MSAPRQLLQDRPAPLAVTLKGARDYVQGSQMLARAAEVVGADILLACAFHRLTASAVAATMLSPGERPPEEACGDAEFARGRERVRVAFMEQPGLAPRAGDTAGWTLGAVVESKLEGEFAYAGAAHFESRLEVVVRALKTLHEAEAGPGARAIFTGVRRASFACGTLPDAGILRIASLRALQTAGGWQTLSRLELSPEGAPPQAALASFAVVGQGSRDAA
jgi:hypothetical protein